MLTIDKFYNGDTIALAKIISHIENRGSQVDQILAEIYPKTGKALSIGITGPPGAGKSTIVDKISSMFTKAGKTVGIIAVDPTSPFTGGALLGDRIRMQDLTLNKDIFIRSMASRGSSGGLAYATSEIIKVLDAFGKDIIIVETVGVGQVELDVAEACDITVVVLVPESGDSVQALKAGLMEIADIFCINKSDRPGSKSMISELNMIMDIKRQKSSKAFPAIATQAVNNIGLDDLVKSIENEFGRLKINNSYENYRKKKIRYDILKTIEHKLKDKVRNEILTDDVLSKHINNIYEGHGNPYDLAKNLIDNLK